MSSASRLRQWLGGIALAVLAAAWSGVVQADEELNWDLDKGEIKEIHFLGNVTFDDGELKKVLGLDEIRSLDLFRIFHNPNYTQDQLFQGIEAIRGFYRRQGFHQIEVRLQKIEKSGGDDIVTIAVTEGPRTLVDEVYIEGAEPLDPSYLRSRLEFEPGDPAPYRALDVGRDTYRILNEYVSRGYLAARVEERIEPRDSLVTLRYHIYPGAEFRVGEIRIEGNTSTNRRHIEREMTIQVGQPFNAREITLSESKLLSTGWFRNASLEPAELDTTKGEAVLLVNVVEGKTQFIEAGVGVGEPEIFRATGAIGERNLWGTGRALTLRGLGLAVQGVDPDNPNDEKWFWDYETELVFFSPRFLTLPLRTSVRLFQRQETLPQSRALLMRRGLAVGSPVLEGFRSRLDLGLSLERIKNFDPPDPELINPALTNSLRAVWSWDSRDDPFSPVRGHRRQLTLQTAGGPVLRGNNRFHKISGSWVAFFPLPRRATVGLRAQAGWAKPHGWGQDWNKNDEVPIEDRFFAGGARSVRGYREKILGPRLTDESFLDPIVEANTPSKGGRVQLLLNAELRMPLVWGFGMTVFFDGGNVWDSWEDFRKANFRLAEPLPREEGKSPQDTNAEVLLDLRTGLGVGIHYNTIVGPLRLEYGIPLKRVRLAELGETGNYEVDDPFMWHFSLGHAF